MVKQREVNLNEPLDVKAKPTLNKFALTPEFSQAALTLHGDYYRQLQGKCNKYIIWHPISLSIIVSACSAFMFYRLYDFISVSESIGEFLGFFWKNGEFQYLLLSFFPSLICMVAVVGCVSYFVSDDFRLISDVLPEDEFIEDLFGFDLKKFAKLSESKLLKEKRNLSPKEVQFLKNGENTHVVVYRDSPIAVITLKPLLDRSTETNFVVKITGLQVRKVFSKVDFDGLLLEWSFVRSREIFQDFIKNRKNSEGSKITILTDAYSFDKQYVNVLKSRSFGKISSSYELSPFKRIAKKEGARVGSSWILLNKVFNVSRDTYGVTLFTKDADEDLILKASKSGNENFTSTTRSRKR